MDIAGAKALKRRLGGNGAEDARPVSADVPEDAPPVYHWTGVSKAAPETPTGDVDDEGSTVSFFRRLGLSFR
jgi:hypothetical protein